MSNATDNNIGSSRYKYYDIVAVVFVAVLLISNIAAQKLFAFGPFTFTAAILLFPVAYIFGDILTEVYGYARARRVIWMGFAANILMVFTISIAVWLPPADGWPLQEQFASVMSLVPRVVFASILGYWAGEFTNSFVLAKMKLLTEGKHLWARTIGSTIAGQGVDTIIFALVAFWGIIPASTLLAAIVSGYIFKVVYEAIATPLTYFIVNYLKRKEGIDVYDRGTNFTPFTMKLDK